MTFTTLFKENNSFLSQLLKIHSKFGPTINNAQILSLTANRSSAARVALITWTSVWLRRALAICCSVSLSISRFLVQLYWCWRRLRQIIRSTLTKLYAAYSKRRRRRQNSNSCLAHIDRSSCARCFAPFALCSPCLYPGLIEWNTQVNKQNKRYKQTWIFYRQCVTVCVCVCVHNKCS